MIVKCHGDRLFTTGLRCLLRTVNYAIITKEGMQEGYYDDRLLKFLFQLEPENFQRSPAVRNKFAKLLKKEKEKHTLLRTAKICLEITRCKV